MLVVLHTVSSMERRELIEFKCFSRAHIQWGCSSGAGRVLIRGIEEISYSKADISLLAGSLLSYRFSILP